jgi:hypothetical protein
VGGFRLFDMVFLAGVLLSVRVMVSGVASHRGTGEAVVRSRFAMLAGALTLAGFLGAVSVRLWPSAFLASALPLAGVVTGALSARWLVARAAALPIVDDEGDPRFALQGFPAVVVDSIPVNGDGKVQLSSGRHATPPIRARSVDGSAIARGVEVGVERIDGDIAFVEAWSAIEARL